MALKIVYFDPSKPDAGAAGTYANPYTQQSQLSYANLGDECDIMCPRGLLYWNSGSAAGIWYSSALTPTGRIRWMPYDTGPDMPPTAFGGHSMKPGDTGWSYLGSGVWKKTFVYTSAALSQSPTSMRLFVGGAGPTGPVQNRSIGTGYVIGTALARAAISEQAAVSGDAEVIAALHHPTGIGNYYREWMYTIDLASTTGALYVYTGTALQDPPTFYDGIVLVAYNGLVGPTGVGRVAGIRTVNSFNIEYIGLDTVFAPGGIVLAGGTTNGTQWENCSARACNTYAFGYAGISISGSGSGRLARNFRVADAIVDSMGSDAEEWNFRDKGGITWINGYQDGSIIGACTTDCTLERVDTRDAGHSNTFIGAVTNIGYTINARVIDCKASQANRRYGYLLSSVGLGAGNIARVDRFRGADSPSFVHNTGSGKTIISDSTLERGTKPYPAYDARALNDGEATGTEVNTIPGLDIFKNAAMGNIEAGCITLERCTVVNPYGPMIELMSSGDATGTVIPPGSLTATDTLFVDLTYLNDPAARLYNYGTIVRPGMSISARDFGEAVGAIQFNNVRWWTDSIGQPRVATPPAGDPPLVPLASWAGLAGTWSEADPKVDARGRPIIGSPLFDAGTSTTPPRRDVEGKQRPNPPSIGAYDRATLRKRLVTDPAL